MLKEEVLQCRQDQVEGLDYDKINGTKTRLNYKQ